jgi:hypothetical protein
MMVVLLAMPGISAGQARNRNGGDDSSSGQAVPRGSVPAPSPAPAPAPAAAPAPTPAPAPSAPASDNPSAQAGRRTAPRVVAPSDSSPANSGQGARPRDGRATVGTAVPRGSVPRPLPPDNPPPVYVSYWPYGFGGLGFGSYYGSYYGGFYDPFYYPGYGGYGYPGYAYPTSSYTSGFEGSLRLKIKPRDAQVFVDGYYAGVVDEFDGVFQRLHVEAGPHRIEIRAAGFEPLIFDVRVQFDETTNLEGELQRLP